MPGGRPIAFTGAQDAAFAHALFMLNPQQILVLLAYLQLRSLPNRAQLLADVSKLAV